MEVHIVKIQPAQLPHLETFSKAAELSSFTGAARELHVSQAAVSQRVHALERALGKTLFQRQGGGVLLTDAGRMLYDYAQRILELHSQARRDVTGQETPLAGELLLSASSIPGEYLLPGLLSVFGQRHPRIHVRAAVLNSRSVMTQVERGEASLGLVGQKNDRPHLDFSRLATDRMVLVAPSGHALGKRSTVSLSQIAGYPLVARGAGSGLRHCLEAALEQAGWSLADLHVALELDSNEAIKEAVLQGVGVAILSTYAVQKEVQAGRMLAIGIRDLDCDRDLYVVRDRRRALPLPARAFLSFLENNPIPNVAP